MATGQDSGSASSVVDPEGVLWNPPLRHKYTPSLIRLESTASTVATEMNKLFNTCRSGNADEFKRLFSEQDNLKHTLEKEDRNGKKLIHLAAEGGSEEIISIILDQGGARQATLESYSDNDTPLNIALMNGKIPAAYLIFEKLKELGATPRRNRQGNYPLHYACRVGNLQLIQTLSETYPDTVYATNGKGHTPLSFAVWEGNVDAVRILLGRNLGSPELKFPDFNTILPAFSTGERQLEPPIDIFVFGDNQCGKSSLIKSIQAESHYEKFWGLTYNTSDIDAHKIGLIPTDFTAKRYGRVIFHDLASGTKHLNMQLVHSPEDLERALFIVVIDCRPEKREMDRKLEFWLNVVYQQGTQATKISSRVFPNVIIVGSFWDYVKAFRRANEVRLDITYRNVAERNPNLISHLNILERACLDCRKAQSIPMARVRSSLKHHCRRHRIPNTMALDYGCYVLSSILVEKSSKKQHPVISLEELFSEIKEKSAQPDISLHSLIATENISELLELCKALEDRKRILLLRKDVYSSEEDSTIVYDLRTLASSVDAALLDLKSPLDEPSNAKVALIERDKLRDYLSDKLGIRADVIVPVLDAFKIHSLSVQGDMDTLPPDCPHYFIPTLLPEADPNTEDWDESAFCFAWSYQPADNRLYCHFLPSYTNSLLIALFDICAGREDLDFDYHSLWQGGISFRQKDEVEVTVVLFSSAITLNMRYRAEFEIICLNLRNTLLKKIRHLKEIFQPEAETEEFITPPKDGPKFPVRTSSPRNRINLKELKIQISSSTLSLLRSTSVISSLAESHVTDSSQTTHLSQNTRLSNEEHPHPFFEPCYLVAQLDTANLQFLLYPDHSDSEISESFLYELRYRLGYQRYNSLDGYFGFPPITMTPTSSVCGDVGVPGSQQHHSRHSSGGDGSVSSQHHSRHSSSGDGNVSSQHHSRHSSSGDGNVSSQHHSRHSSLSVKCRTYGQLVECLDSISIFSTVEFLTANQNATISRDSITLGSAGNQRSSQSDHTPTPQSEPQQTRRLSPYTTRSTDGYSNIYFVDQLQVFTCGHEGGMFHSAQSGVTIKFPCGAVPEASPPITIEFGVALNGPFEFPADAKPVSPFIWLCTDNPHFVFHKPVEVSIPHFLTLDKTDHDKLTFMKPNHRDVDDEYEFKECMEKKKFKARNSYGVLLTTHTCFLCIAWKYPELAITKINYCLMKVVPRALELSFKIVFYVTYFLEACMETVQRHFSSEDYDIHRTRITLNHALPEPQVSIHFHNQLQHGWTATKEGAENVIPASYIEFWHRDIGQLELMNSYKMYPPRFSIHVCGTEAIKNSILDVRFEGLKQSTNYQIQLQIPVSHRKSVSLNSVRSDTVIYSLPGSIERHLSTVHPLDQMIVELVKFLDVDRVRLGLIRRGILSQEEMETLLDVSLKNFPQSVKVETLVHIVKKKGDLGLQAFMNALEETMDGTGHHSLVEQLKKLLDNYLL